MNFFVGHSVGSVVSLVVYTWLGVLASRVTSPDSGTEHDSSSHNRIVRLKDPHSGGGRHMCGKVSERDITGGEAYCSN